MPTISLSNNFPFIKSYSTSKISPKPKNNLLDNNKLIELCQSEFNQKIAINNLSLKTKSISQIESSDLPTLLYKIGVTEEQLIQRAINQADLVENYKKTFLQAKIKSAFWKIFPETLNFINQLINNILRMIGLDDLERDSETDWQAMEKLRAMFYLFTIPNTLFLIIQETIKSLYPQLLKMMPVLPTLSHSLLALGITSIILLLASIAIGIYLAYFRACPNYIEHFYNLTKEAKQKDFPHIHGRDTEIDDLIARLQNNEGIMLLGPSGVGKSEIIKGLAQRVADGKVPKELKNKKLFSINTARLDNSTLERIEKDLKRYKNEVIIFFDEIHTAWKGPDRQLVDSLKTFIDRFPLCIVATTEQEYRQYRIGEQEAFCRRLKQKYIRPMSADQIEVVLYNHIQEKAPFVELEENILPYIIQRVKEARPNGSEPYGSKLVLSEALVRINNSDPSNALKNRLEQIEQQIEKVKTDYLQGPTNKLLSSMSNLEPFEAEARNIKNFMQSRKMKIQQLNNAKKLMKTAKDTLFDTAIEIKQRKAKKKGIKHLEKKWLTLAHFAIPALQKTVQDRAQELIGIKTTIDRQLIDEIIQEKFPPLPPAA